MQAGCIGARGHARRALDMTQLCIFAEIESSPKRHERRSNHAGGVHQRPGACAEALDLTQLRIFAEIESSRKRVIYLPIKYERSETQGGVSQLPRHVIDRQNRECQTREL